jgi:cytochrome c
MASILKSVLPALLCLSIASPAMADAAAGSKVFKTNCGVCHSTTGAPGIGPTLAGVVGRKAGTQAGFKSQYSPAMKASGLTWTADELEKYIANPAKVVPGNRMPFAGLHDAGQVAALVDYLKTLK